VRQREGENGRRPSVLVPYPGPVVRSDEQDVFVYLRPETNGVEVESAVLRVIERSPVYKRDLKLVYLANVPGSFIARNHIVESHYSTKLFFATHSGRAFTPGMRNAFEEHYGIALNEARVVGGFEALHVLGLTPEELFQIWVPASEVLAVHGQTIKRIDDVFVVNYDIPALLHKNNRNTDIAVMVFRCRASYAVFVEVVDQMREALIAEGHMNASAPLSRLLHYSKGPFEQILDGFDYLFDRNACPASVADLSFACYLMECGISGAEIVAAVRQPIMEFEDSSGQRFEQEIMTYTEHDSYPEALAKFRSARRQFVLKSLA